jgi:hypothetical protein
LTMYPVKVKCTWVNEDRSYMYTEGSIYSAKLNNENIIIEKNNKGETSWCKLKNSNFAHFVIMEDNDEIWDAVVASCRR